MLQRKGRAGRVKEGQSFHFVSRQQARELTPEQLPEMRRTSVVSTLSPL